MAAVVSKTNAFCGSLNHHHRRLRCSSSRRPVSLPIRDRSRDSSSLLVNGFRGLKLTVKQNQGLGLPRCQKPRSFSPKMALSIRKVNKWWEKGLQPNMREINSAQELVDSLTSAGDKLVVLDFFMPGCGGCKALHPKICQFAEKYPDVLFYQVNYEEHKSMCHSLNVHVLPLFRFYRGADGNVCSFSCTNATIKKFKDMLAKHSTERCSLGPPKGLEEKQLIALSANKDLGFSYTPKPAEPATTEIREVMAESLPTKLSDVGAMSRAELRPLPLGVSEGISNEERTLAAAPAR